jgi:hypothetical protein
LASKKLKFCNPIKFFAEKMNFGAHKKSLSLAYDKKTERLFP